MPGKLKNKFLGAWPAPQAEPFRQDSSVPGHGRAEKSAQHRLVLTGRGQKPPCRGAPGLLGTMTGAKPTPPAGTGLLGSVWSLQDWKSCLKMFLNSGGFQSPWEPLAAAPRLSVPTRAQHHHPGPGVGAASAVPTKDQKDLFTQEGLWRCEKSLSSHYLSPGCAKGFSQASLGSYQLQTFICLRAARPPSGGLLPPPEAAPGKPLAVVVGTKSRRRGVTAAAPNRFVTTWEQ